MAIKPEIYYYGFDYLQPGKSVLEILGITTNEEIGPCVQRIAKAVKEAKTPAEQLKVSSGLPLLYKAKSKTRFKLVIDAAERNLRVSLSAPPIPEITLESLNRGIQAYLVRRKSKSNVSQQ